MALRLPTSEPLPADLPLATAMRQTAKYRARHWDALVGAAMAVRADDLDAHGAIAWDRVAQSDPAGPVTAEKLGLWLSGKPALPIVRVLGWLFDVRDPRAVTRADLVRMVAEHHPDALLELLGGSSPNDPLLAELYAVAGRAFGEVSGRRRIEAPFNTFAPAMRWASDEACAAYLEVGMPALDAHELGQVAFHLLQRESISARVRAAYGAALVSAVERLTNKDAPRLYVFSSLLGDEGQTHLEAALRACIKRPKVWARLVALLASQGSVAGANAIAATLEDAKVAAQAAVALATMGETGVKAARSWLDAHASGGAKLKKGLSAARTLLAIPLLAIPGAARGPASAPTLWAGEQYGLPRFGRNPKEDLLDAGAVPSVSGAAPHPPTPLAALEAMMVERPVADLLPPEGWADVLQLLALDPQLSDVAYAWERARDRDLLGRGSDPAVMTAALDRMSASVAFTRHHPPTEFGLGLVLLWAGASREVYRHAVARFELSGAGNVLGARERNFVAPLEVVKPRWADTLRTLCRHYGANRDERAWLGAPPVLTELEAAGPSVELAAPAADLWISGQVMASSRFTVTFRGAVHVTVDVAAERWEITGAVSASGATPPLDRARGVRFTIETARDVMALGIDGAAVHGALSNVPSAIAPVSAVAEGEGASVTRLILHAKYTVRASEAAGTLLLDLDAAQGYTEVAGLGSPPAARVLAASALLLEAPAAQLAKDALLAMPATKDAEDLEPWKALVRSGVTLPEPEMPTKAKRSRKTKAAPPETPTAAIEGPSETTGLRADELPQRSFEDAVRVFFDAKLGVKARSKKPAVLKRGQTQNGDREYVSFAPKPETEDWGARTAVPWPTIYLSDEGPPFDEPKYFVDAIADLPAVCQKGRGTRADVSYVMTEGRYLIASMSVEPPQGNDDWNVWDVAAAAWKVEEGWAWAVMEGPADGLLPLLGMRALPAQIGWKRMSAALGNW